MEENSLMHLNVKIICINARNCLEFVLCDVEESLEERNLESVQG